VLLAGSILPSKQGAGMNRLEAYATRVPAGRLIAPMMGNLGLQLIGASRQDAVANPTLHLKAALAVVERWQPDLYFPVMDLFAEATIIRSMVANSAELRLFLGHRDALSAVDLTADDRFQHHLTSLLSTQRVLLPRCPVVFYITAPFTLASILLSSSDICDAISRKSSLLAPFLDAVIAVQSRFVRYLLQQGAEYFCLLDPTASLLSSTDFTAVAATGLTAIINLLHQHQASCILHICGNTTPLMPQLVDLGADALSLDAESAGVDWPSIVRQYAGTLFMGGPDPVTLAQSSTTAAGKITTAILQQTAHLHHVILSTACELPVGTPLATVDSLMRTAKKWRTNRPAQA
jgi:uroporphyrinogen-III decarboxylase